MLTLGQTVRQYTTATTKYALNTVRFMTFFLLHIWKFLIGRGAFIFLTQQYGSNKTPAVVLLIHR